MVNEREILCLLQYWIWELYFNLGFSHRILTVKHTFVKFAIVIGHDFPFKVGLAGKKRSWLTVFSYEFTNARLECVEKQKLQTQPLKRKAKMVRMKGASEASAGGIASCVGRWYIAFAVSSLLPSFAPRPISHESKRSYLLRKEMQCQRRQIK